ncbi:RAB33A [Mytilus edulis]|uniref:RAB33A n=1 Tax=Mytilus edulis TaxID=6550 RepID=A0A8S3U051_MYTED|nr:RAB33A [Mytilus edulis]
MDLSKSQSGPQSITQFELCESDPKISRKCFNIFMCVACKNNIHPENETAWKQKNSDIKQIEIRDDRGRTTSDIRDGPASVDCDLLMCVTCKNNIHPKIKTVGEHRIIPIKDIGKAPAASKDVGSKISLSRSMDGIEDKCMVVVMDHGEYHQKKYVEDKIKGIAFPTRNSGTSKYNEL